MHVRTSACQDEISYTGYFPPTISSSILYIGIHRHASRMGQGVLGWRASPRGVISCMDVCMVCMDVDPCPSRSPPPPLPGEPLHRYSRGRSGYGGGLPGWRAPGRVVRVLWCIDEARRAGGGLMAPGRAAQNNGMCNGDSSRNEKARSRERALSVVGERNQLAQCCQPRLFYASETQAPRLFSRAVSYGSATGAGRQAVRGYQPLRATA